MPVTYCDVFAFLWRSIQAMGCFFDCFGVNPDRPRRRPHHLLPDTPPPTTPAKLLKACGTLPQTPAEIRKAVSRVEGSEMADTQKPLSALMSSPENHAEVEQLETSAEKSARLDLPSPQSLLESSPETPGEIRKEEASTENIQRSDLRGPLGTLKSSPYPTPMKITDDMQTPGTVFATNMKNLTKGNARIRSQYVYTVLNPIENLSQLEELKEEHAILDELSNREEQFSEIGNTTSSSPVGSAENVVTKENIGEATLSSWLKSNDNGDCLNHGAKKHNMAKDIGDRPIIGLVATHWTEQDETSHVSPKSWDGNGIPNSTSKYKEDQKVRWHATPFEERLEKALSEETMPRRKPTTGMPIMLEGMEEDDNDTATSHIQSMSCAKSVVSF